MKTLSSRRNFLRHLGAASLGAPAFVRHLISAPPSNRVRLACFGANGMAWTDLVSHLANRNVELHCVAEVDLDRLGKLALRFPDRQVRIYQDWRRLLDNEAKHLDAVSIGTPDHMHAPIGISTMELGLHTFLQKPLAHDVFEARKLAELATAKKLHTQMGIQLHSSSQYRTAVALVRAGTIGKVREVHSWCQKKWGDPAAAPQQTDPVPPGLDWNNWLGVVEPRPFVKGAYHPGAWRKRLDFGTGTLGDMGCHIFDPVVSALQLGQPLTVRSEGNAPNEWSWATDAVIRYVFGGTPYTEQMLMLNWYDGDTIPPSAHFNDLRYQRLVSDNTHYAQFTAAILGGPPPSAGFDYSGPLTETVLLGTIASFFPQTTLVWDRAALQFKNVPEANAKVRRRYRKGWEIAALE
ncbi:MAG: gfo/Idh/MocA family oxidoreductase [Verrucomicrobia bacterium]|nr:gfo/Idh/MocA family oxidoreductase [Verrucomicrobiota bacterium]